jgi:hypothetical protein
MISVSPLSGYKFITTFTVSISPSSNDNIINWDDGNFSNSATATHIYSAADIYSLYAGNCGATSAFNLSVFNGGFLENNICVRYDTLSSVASCPKTFSVYISSVNPYSTVYFYSSGSKSYPYNSERNFWSHLNPEWYFAELDGTPISQMSITGTPIYSNSVVLGYSALSSVLYVDAMPGAPNLFFTMVLNDCDVPINSRVYSALQFNVIPDVPKKLLITADGLNPINGIQWSDLNIPYVVSVQGLCACDTIMHYACGYIAQNKSNQLCFGVDNGNYAYYVSAINLTDKDCFNTGGYSMNTFVLPSSSIPLYELSNNINDITCNPKSLDELEYSYARKSPYIQLSAVAVVNVNGSVYTLSGVSNSFYVHKFENFHRFYRRGEHKNVYDFIKQYSHFDFAQIPNFNTYLSSIAGSGDTLGKVYDKIVNIPKDTADIDLCNIDFVHDIANKMDIELDDFFLTYPEELKRLMNFFSIPLEKLIGTRCVCNTQFTCLNCCGKNICGLCGYDKKSNLGEQLTLGDYVTAGETILIREHGSEIFEFLPIQYTSLLRDLTAVSTDSYCFFKWNDFHQGNPVEGIVDYLNPNNMLNKSLSSYNDWYADNGVIEEMLNYTLTKNLINN